MIPKIKYLPSYDGEFLYVETYHNDKVIKNNFIIMHGLGGDSNATLLLIKDILKSIPNTKCITYDLRGHGLSSKKIPTDANNIESIGAKDLSFVCNYFKINNPVFVCHSIGGVFVQTYLETKLKPEPKHTLLLCSPLKTAPFSISRNFWFKIYKIMSPLLMVNNKKRQLNQHLKYKDTFDLSPSRIFSDIYYLGFFNFTFIYLSLMGWGNTNLETLNKKNIYFCCGIKDVLLPEKKQRSILKKIKNIKISSFDSNHHQIYINNHGKISDLLKLITNQA